MLNFMKKHLAMKLAAVASLVAFSSIALGETVLISDQLRPVEEAQTLRAVLSNAPDDVEFLPEEGAILVTKIEAEQQAGEGTNHVVASLHGTFPVLDNAGAMSDVSSLMNRLSSRGFSDVFVNLGQMDGEQIYVPWMQATYIMAANTKALRYLPQGADIQALSYDELKEWARTIHEETGNRALGFPAGPRGLKHRFFQGYLYPSYTDGVVRTFKSPAAEAMWADFKDLWQYVNPRSTSYDSMDEPLLAEEVWIAFDHTARLRSAFENRPDDFVGFAAPAGPEGRGFMPVLVGLGIPNTTPDRRASERLIDFLTTSETQTAVLREAGWFPVVEATTDGLPPAVQLAAVAIEAQTSAPDANPGLLPIGLGDQGGAFSKVYSDTFQEIVLNDADISDTLARQGRILERIMQRANAPCWAPDAPSGEQPCPVE